MNVIYNVINYNDNYYTFQWSRMVLNETSHPRHYDLRNAPPVHCSRPFRQWHKMRLTGSQPPPEIMIYIYNITMYNIYYIYYECNI